MKTMILLITLGLLAVIILGIASLASEVRPPENPHLTPWEPVQLATQTATATPTHGWWGDLPTPASLSATPLFTARPSSTPTPTLSSTPPEEN